MPFLRSSLESLQCESSHIEWQLPAVVGRTGVEFVQTHPHSLVLLTNTSGKTDRFGVAHIVAITVDTAGSHGIFTLCL